MRGIRSIMRRYLCLIMQVSQVFSRRYRQSLFDHDIHADYRFLITDAVCPTSCDSIAIINEPLPVEMILHVWIILPAIPSRPLMLSILDWNSTRGEREAQSSIALITLVEHPSRFLFRPFVSLVSCRLSRTLPAGLRGTRICSFNYYARYLSGSRGKKLDFRRGNSYSLRSGGITARNSTRRASARARYGRKKSRLILKFPC